MKKKHSGPQIVAKLRQADILIGQGKTIPEVCKEIDVYCFRLKNPVYLNLALSQVR
jgi:hypothetical protein